MRWHQRLRSLLSVQQPIEAKKRPQRRVLLQLEELETRALLSASGVTAEPNLTIAPAQSSGFSGYTPDQIKTAYGITSSTGSGAGQTIAIVDAYNDPTIISDANAFSAQFSLPQFNNSGGPTLTVVNQNGSQSQGTLPANNASWAVEESLDVEWAHAIAPGANIVLVEANSSSLNDLMTAVSTASNMANVVSMSWGAGEFNGETSYDKYFTTPGVTYVASAGDSSAYFGPEWPASSPNVLAVGGTTLNVTSSNQVANQSNETAWSASFSWYYGLEGGGGGISSYEQAPSFQSDIPIAQQYNARTTPDVSWDANPSTGVSVYDSYGTSGSHWGYVGGTSVGAPSWAGVVAIADQQAGQSLSTSQVENSLYGAYSSSNSAYNSVLNDIKTGNNGYPATTGYDLATGLGSPKVSALVDKLATPASPPLSPSPLPPPPSPPPPSPPHHGHRRDILGTIGGTSVSSIVVLATNVPITVTAASSVGSSTSAVNNVSAFGLSFAQPSSMSQTSNAPRHNGSLGSSASQSTLVFGASGWKGSALSWHLSSLGLSAPRVEPLADDLPEDLQDVDDLSAEDAIDGDATASGEDWSLLDVAAPPILDGNGVRSDGVTAGSESEGGAGGDGSAGGDGGGE